MKTLIAVWIAWSSFAFAEEKIIYQYKKYEKFDLGDLEVKGQLIAPGDLSVRDRDRRRFELELYNRTDFEDMAAHDVQTLR
jgi:hypothetical protein